MNIDVIKQQAIHILKKHGVQRASLFGSAARGEMTDKSDIDFLIEVPSQYRGLDYFGFKQTLQQDLESTLQSQVDLVEFKLVKDTLKKYILSDEQPLLS